MYVFKEVNYDGNEYLEVYNIKTSIHSSKRKILKV